MKGPKTGHTGCILTERSVEMRATVNENCIGCGLCAGTCPVVFVMGDDGFAKGGEVPDSDLFNAQQARDGCPVDAIDIE